MTEPRSTDAPARSLSRRDADLRELMDDPACDPVLLRRTLERFAIVNRLISGWGSVYRRHVRPLTRTAARADGSLSVLDIGCGGGDVLRRLARLARADGVEVVAVGIDPDERALEVARAASTGEAEYRQAYSSELIGEGRRFDVVISNHVLHHLGDDGLRTVLGDSRALSRGLVLHSDIARSRTAFAAYAAAITPLAPGSFLRTDGLRSIRRSWTPSELTRHLAADPAYAGWRVERPAPFRLLLTSSAAPRGAS